MEHIIYALKCPKTLRVRYVGYTRQAIEKRLMNHVSDARCGRQQARCDWIRKLLSQGTLPIIAILEICEHFNWQDRERYWIAEFGGMEKLLNHTNGGDGGRVFSEQTRAKMAKAKLGKKRGPHSAEHRARIAKAVAGHVRTHTPEAKLKISVRLKARLATDKTSGIGRWA